MSTIYRLIKYEHKPGYEDAIDKQLEQSLSNGIYEFNPYVTISVKTCNDDPSAQGFWDDLELAHRTHPIVEETNRNLPWYNVGSTNTSRGQEDAPNKEADVQRPQS